MPPGTLFVVATPIGNLEDITLRALRVLREVDLIAAEDTRRTAKLLTHHGISTRTISFHAHNARARTPQLIERLQAGTSLAVVSDAGTPGISDPGVEIVKACVEAGIRVDPVPGVSAPMAAVVASGFAALPLCIFGFAPARVKDRTRFLTEINETPHTCTFFETPTRISLTLDAAAFILGDRPIMVGRELTKIHQEFVHGTAAALAPRFREGRGEFTVVVGPPETVGVAPIVVDDERVAEEFWRIAKSAGTRRQALAVVAKSFGLSQRDVYAAIERQKISGE